jgi:hypothetical protein
MPTARAVPQTRTRAGIACVAAILLSLPAAAAPPMSVDDLLAVKWISQLTLSPDGKLAAFTVSKADREKNTRPSSIYLLPLGRGKLRQLTTHV